MTSESGILRRGDVVNGRYRVEDLLGRGGMSQVVSATDLELGRKVAVKVPRAERAHSPKDIKRSVREARAVARLASPHTARLFESGTFIRRGMKIPYLVLEYVDGVDLETWLRAKGRVDTVTAATILVQACDAIGEAHQHGLVHRDIKPANMMITASTDGHLIVKVLDFGIAREIAPDPRLTNTGDLLGSPTHMAPEQLRPTAVVDARTDIWALGVVLFELVTGRLPFESVSLPELCLKILLDEPAALPDDCPAELSAIVCRCLAKEPSERIPSVREIVTALRPLTSLQLSISPTDLEVAAIDAAQRDFVTSDIVPIESGPGKRWSWRRRAAVAVALAFACGVIVNLTEPAIRPTYMPLPVPTETDRPDVSLRPVASKQQPATPETRSGAPHAAPSQSTHASQRHGRPTRAKRVTSIPRARKRILKSPLINEPVPLSSSTPVRPVDPLASPF